MHPKFDLELWCQKVGPEATEPSIETEGRLYSDSPDQIVTVEHYRRLAVAGGANLGPALPTDVCVFGSGEPPQQHLTKVNGLPYRPSSRPWPHDCEGVPLTFLCQFCFVDSRDHMEELPGDVLLVFMRTELNRIYSEHYPTSPAEDDAFHFEWYPLGLNDVLTKPISPLFAFPIRYVVLHRSCDYVDLTNAIEAVEKLVPHAKLPSHEFYRATTLRSLVCWADIKMGGIPFWEGGHHEEARGKFLASFSGVSGSPLCEYPRIDQREKVGLNEALHDSNYLEFPAVYTLNFFLLDDETVCCNPEFV